MEEVKGSNPLRSTKILRLPSSCLALSDTEIGTDMMIASGIEFPEARIADICRRHQVGELSLFGSAARGDMGPDSDIDLLVDFLPGARPGLLGFSAMIGSSPSCLGVVWTSRSSPRSSRSSGP